jgi:hypothetical protein
LASQKGCAPLGQGASRFRNCVCTERNRIGGARKKWGIQRPGATLRREIHAAQEVLEARVGAEGLNEDKCDSLMDRNERSSLAEVEDRRCARVWQYAGA